jgi:hypothetical protein
VRLRELLRGPQPRDPVAEGDIVTFELLPSFEDAPDAAGLSRSSRARRLRSKTASWSRYQASRLSSYTARAAG